MAYVLIRGARNTLAVRRPRTVRWHRGFRGLGQVNADGTPCGDVGEPDCVDISTGITQQIGPQNLGPFAGGTASSNPTLSTLPSPGSAGSLAPMSCPSGSVLNSSGACESVAVSIGSPTGCPSGQVQINQYGDCGPSATLVATLASPSGASSLGLSPQAAAQIANALNATNTAVKIATGQPVGGPVAVVSTNPFASISGTTWLIAAAVLAGIVLVSKKR